MSTVALKQLTPEIPGSPLERLKGQKGATLEAEKQRLRRATKEFEAFFTHYLLKTMRESIPENSLTKDLPMGAEAGRDIFTDLFDMELSRQVSGSAPGSLGDVLYKAMEPVIEAQYTESGGEAPALKPLRPDTQHALPLKPDPISIPGRTDNFQTLKKDPIRTSSSPDNLPADSISARFGTAIQRASSRHGVDPALVHAVIKAESDGDPQAVSTAGAKGLMQLIDSTAQALGVSDVFDPGQNIEAGTKYLRHLLDRFDDPRLAVAAYNAGPANVERYGGIPPFPETEKYVTRVMDSVKTVTSESNELPKAQSNTSR